MLVWVVLAAPGGAQPTVEFYAGGSYYLLPPDYNNAILDDKRFDFSNDYKLRMTVPLGRGHVLSLSISQMDLAIERRQKVVSVMGQFQYWAPYLTLSHRIYPVDLGWLSSDRPWSGYGPALSIIGHQRTLAYHYPIFTKPAVPDIIDRLGGWGLGAAWMIRHRITGGNRLALLLDVELRYGRILWFNAGPRDLSGYRLEFFHLQGSLGLGLKR